MHARAAPVCDVDSRTETLRSSLSPERHRTPPPPPKKTPSSRALTVHRPASYVKVLKNQEVGATRKRRDDDEHPKTASLLGGQLPKTAPRLLLRQSFYRKDVYASFMRSAEAVANRNKNEGLVTGRVVAFGLMAGGGKAEKKGLSEKNEIQLPLTSTAEHMPTSSTCFLPPRDARNAPLLYSE